MTSVFSAWVWDAVFLSTVPPDQHVYKSTGTVLFTNSSRASLAWQGHIGIIWLLTAVALALLSLSEFCLSVSLLGRLEGRWCR